jgi:hypothetical protein
MKCDNNVSSNNIKFLNCCTSTILAGLFLPYLLISFIGRLFSISYLVMTTLVPEKLFDHSLKEKIVLILLFLLIKLVLS